MRVGLCQLHNITVVQCQKKLEEDLSWIFLHASPTVIIIIISLILCG